MLLIPLSVAILAALKVLCLLGKQITDMNYTQFSKQTGSPPSRCQETECPVALMDDILMDGSPSLLTRQKG